jgi:hypothetical protein
MFKVGDKVRVLLGGYEQFTVIVKEVDRDSFFPIACFPPPEYEDVTTEWLFFEDELELVEKDPWEVSLCEPHGWYIFNKGDNEYLHKDLTTTYFCGSSEFHDTKEEAEALLREYLGEETQPTFKFKVGDRVVVDERGATYSYFKVGEVVTITSLPKKTGDCYSAINDKGDEQFLFEEQMTLFEETQPVKETKPMKVPFTITSNIISVFIDGQSHFVNSSDKVFAELKEHLKGDHDVEVIRNLVDKKIYVTKITEGLVEVTDAGVSYRGEHVHNTLTEKLLFLLEEGFDVRPWAKFMDNLMQNPSYKSREALFNFLEKWSAPITEDGCFLAFKNVRSDFRDIHSGTFDNTPGTIVSMPRDQVDDDSNRTCSAGLHAAATSYLKHFYVSGAKTVVVKINPRDVVAVPYDYDSAKMRVCQYEVLREVEQDEINRLEQSVLTTSVGDEWDFDIVRFLDLEMYEVEMSSDDGEYYNSYDDYYDSYDDNA